MFWGALAICLFIMTLADHAGCGRGGVAQMALTFGISLTFLHTIPSLIRGKLPGWAFMAYASMIVCSFAFLDAGSSRWKIHFCEVILGNYGTVEL